MRRVPKVLRIMGHRIPITLASGPIPYDDPDGHASTAFGMSYTNDLTISLADTNTPERQKVTLIHEALHTMIEVGHVTSEDEEDAVTHLAPLLLDFVRANKAAIAWLQEV